MDLKSILLYAAVVAVSAGLAFAVFSGNDTKTEPGSEKTQAVADPAWYRTASYGTRLSELYENLGTMTSRAVAPEQTGNIKDEIALLCQDEKIVDVVIDTFHSHPNMTPALLSAYMEICARVKSPKLAPLIKRGFDSMEFDVRMNAADAGILHGDPRAVEEMGQALQQCNITQALRLVASLAAAGGNDALHWLEQTLSSRTEPELQSLICRALGQAGYIHGIDSLRELKEKSPSSRVSFSAAASLASMGQDDGFRFLLALLEDDTKAPVERAESVQTVFRLSGARHRASFAKLAEVPDIVGFEARLCMAKLRDEATLASLKKLSLGDDLVAQSKAVGTLAASGSTEDVDFLLEHLDRFNAYTLNVLINALKRGKPKNGPVLLAKLASSPRPEAGIAMRSFPEFGEPTLDELQRILMTEKDKMRRDILLRAVAAIPSAKSIKILEDFPIGNDRELWFLVRSLIRKIDISLLKR